MKKAILATVVSVERKSLDSVVVELESDELEKGTAIVSTGLDFERGCESTKLGLEVTCAGDPLIVHAVFSTKDRRPFLHSEEIPIRPSITANFPIRKSFVSF